MNVVIIMACILGLALTVVPGVLVFVGVISMATHALLMAVGAALWFAAAPRWLRSDTAKP